MCDCVFPKTWTKSRQEIKPHYARYACWSAMLRRCHISTDKDFIHYGGRGVAVCEAWMNDFQKYLSDIGEAPEGMTLDRRDNDGNYCPHNIKWSTASEQNLNRRPPQKHLELPKYICKAKDRYNGQVVIGKHCYHLGSSKDLNVVIKLVNEFCREWFGTTSQTTSKELPT